MSDIASIEEMKQEAVKRLELLKLDNNIIDDFKAGKIWMSDNTKMSEVPEEILKDIKAHQRKFRELVFHVVHTHFMGHETYECLTVSPFKSDWDYERLDAAGWVMSHSINMSIPENTESGSVRLENKNGILVRIN